MKEICSINGVIKDQSTAKLNLEHIESQYNFGVYETIKLRNSILYFLPQHIQRLFHSALSINLRHEFTEKNIAQFIQNYIKELGEESCNLKVLLYGSSIPQNSSIYLLASAPHYPDRKWYKQGVALKTAEYERWMPGAKTLNMLPSYYFYSEAKRNGCYDALLLDRNKNILEGTRTNVYLLKNKTLFCAPKNKILEGVTMMSLEKVIAHSSFHIHYGEIPISTISSYEGMIITSTSTKILPVKKIDAFEFEKISEDIFELEKLYDSRLAKCNGDFEKL